MQSIWNASTDKAAELLACLRCRGSWIAVILSVKMHIFGLRASYSRTLEAYTWFLAKEGGLRGEPKGRDQNKPGQEYIVP